VIWEGEGAPEQTPDDGIAFRAYRLLANGMGGIDWSGLPLVCAWLGVRDVEAFLHRLEVIQAHKPPEDDSPQA
jgi:hypothetical protein